MDKVSDVLRELQHQETGSVLEIEKSLADVDAKILNLCKAIEQGEDLNLRLSEHKWISAERIAPTSADHGFLSGPDCFASFSNSSNHPAMTASGRGSDRRYCSRVFPQ